MARAWTYDPVGNITAITSGSANLLNQGKGQRATATYYLSNLLRQSKEPVPSSAITLPSGVTQPPTDSGDPASTTYNIASFTYNLLGQKTDMWDGNNYKAYTDAAGINNYRTSYAYDDLDRLGSVTVYMPTGNLTTVYGYDNNGNQISATDPRGKTTSYRYDGFNRMWRLSDGRGIVNVQYRFDDAGNMSQEIEPRTNQNRQAWTNTTNFTYDLAHRLTRIAYQRSGQTYGSPNVNYAYDGAGRRVYMWDGYSPKFYSYDGMGRLAEERGIQELVTYAYDLASRMTSMTSHLGATTYSYDSGDRLTQVKDPLNFQTTYSYDQDYGYLASQVLPLGGTNTLTRTNTVHKLSDGTATGRMQQITYNKKIGTTTTQVWQATYTYDLPGMIRTASFRDSSSGTAVTTNHTYNYDQSYRLTQADGASGNTSHPNDRYAYDSSGNRTTWGNELVSNVIYDYDKAPVGTSSTVYQWKITETNDDANRATVVDYQSGSLRVYQRLIYEDNGNLWGEEWDLTGFSGKCGLTGGRSMYYYYDDANRLLERWDTNTTVYANRQNRTTFQYDGDGRRLVQRYQQMDYNTSCVQQPVWTDFTAYEYANGEVLNERTNGNVPVWYIRDPYGNLLYTLHWRTNQLQPDAYVMDHLGSIRIVLDYQGAAANKYTYDAYGAITASSATLRNSYSFTGYALDSRTGLYYAKARYYSPTLGRFLSQDTWKGSPWEPWTQNVYSYVGGNPVNYVDPTGHNRVVVTTDIMGGPPLPIPLHLQMLESGLRIAIAKSDAKKPRCVQTVNGTLCEPVKDMKLGNRGFSLTPVTNPASGKVKPHLGQDIPTGLQPVYAVKDGVVDTVVDTCTLEDGKQCGGGHGNKVVIEHFDGTKTVSAHLSAATVSPNTLVLAGAQIGVSGSTGNSTGNHLHLEYWANSKPVNPLQLLNPLIE